MIVDVHAHGLSEDFIIAAANDPARLARGVSGAASIHRRRITVRWIRLSLIRRGRRRPRASH